MRTPKNVSASVRARLLNYSRAQGENFNYVLTRYGIERLLYRLGRSDQADAFILKGAMLFSIWTDVRHRATHDVDLLSTGVPDLERLADTFRRVCQTLVEDDGIVFDPETVSATRIRKGEEYEGVRVTLRGHLGSARIDLQVDIGFGDAVTPGPVHVEMTPLLDKPAPSLASYPRETVVAEKLHAMVTLGMANSRMKDFFDIDFLCANFDFDGELLARAVRATFERRRTALPREVPIAFTDRFMEDAAKQIQWRAFLRKSGLAADMDLVATIWRVAAFGWPVIKAARNGTSIGKWTRERGWFIESNRSC